MSRRMPALLALLAALAAIPPAGAAPDPARPYAASSVLSCTDSLDVNSPVVSDSFAFNLSNTRDNPSQITSANVAQLQPAWAHAAVGATGMRGTPALTQQALFVSAKDYVLALNRKTGCQYWAYQVPYRKQLFSDPNMVRSSAIEFVPPSAYGPALVVFGDSYGYYYVLDAQTGRLRGSRFIGEDKLEHFITGGAQYYQGVMYAPVASREVITTSFDLVQACCVTHGLMRAANPYTGFYQWTWDTAPPAVLQPDGHYAPNGMSLWGTPAIDPARHQLYIGTGQNYSPPATDDSDSVVALDLASGTVKWVFQGTADDAWNGSCQLFPPLDFQCFGGTGWDYDFGAAPILATLPNGQQAVIGGEKSGVVYSLDPDTGRLNWSQRVGAGGNLGGVHWGMATDGQNVYVAVSDLTTLKISGISGLSQLGKETQPDGATPGVYALDLATGAVKWKFATTHEYQGQSYDSIFSAAVSVTNDVVFAGSLDGKLFALRAGDGKLLWSYDTTPGFTDVNGQAGHGGTIDSVGAVPAGSDLMINSGYDQFGTTNSFQAGNGNALLVLRLPGQN